MLGIGGGSRRATKQAVGLHPFPIFFPFPATTDAVSEVHEKNFGFFSPLNAFRGLESCSVFLKRWRASRKCEIHELIQSFDRWFRALNSVFVTFNWES